MTFIKHIIFSIISSLLLMGCQTTQGPSANGQSSSSVSNLSEGQALDACASLDSPENASVAIAACSRAIESSAFKDDVLASLHFNRGLSYLDANASDKAILDFKKAIDINPEHVNANIALGWEYDLIEKVELADEYFENAIDLSPDNAEAHCGKGWVYAKKKQYDRSLALSRQSMDLESNACAASIIGWVLREKGKLLEAIAAYELAIQLDPEHRFSWAELSWSRYDMEQYPEAEEAAINALKIDPNHSYSLIALGWAQREQNKLDEALDSFAKAAKRAPKDPYANYGHGYVLDDLGRYSEALTSYDKAIEYGEGEASHYNARALVYRRLGRFEDAESDLRRAGILAESSAVIWYNLATVLVSTDKLDEALKVFDKAVNMEKMESMIEQFTSTLRSNNHNLKADEIKTRMSGSNA